MSPQVRTTRYIRAALLLGLGFSAQCAELSIDSVTAQVGTSVPLAVRFVAAGSQVAALQFDLSFDSTTMALGTAAGANATSAGKTVYSASVAIGLTRVLLAGLNQNTLSDGSVVTLTALVTNSSAAGAYALRLTNAIASDQAGNILPLTTSDGSVTANGSASLPPSGIFAQVASGGGWTTSFTLLNLLPAASGANLTFWNDDGTPLALPLTFSPELGQLPTTSSSIDFVIPANGVALVETELPEAAAATVGWTRLTAPAGVVGSATFRYQSTATQDLEAVVPLETRTPASFVLPFDNTAGLTTGVALANGSDTSTANIQIIARNAAGAQLLTGSISLPVRGHTSFMLATRYPSLVGILGSLEFQNPSGGNISVLGLRINQTGSLTSIPAQAK
jgi:hypothetical protein